MTDSTAYFMLAAATGTPPCLVTGYGRDGRAENITADPRRLILWEIFAEEPEQGLIARSARLLRLQPDGPVIENPDDPGYFECLSGWTVTACTNDLSPVLGPQAPQVMAAIIRAEQAIAAGGGPDWDRYVDTTDAIGDDDATTAAFVDADDAARAALQAAGADSLFWSLIGAGAYGPEILALAARDLIGRSPGWTQAAYDLLTGPWEKAFGPACPADHASAATAR